jgi:hypothetical protein
MFVLTEDIEAKLEDILLRFYHVGFWQISEL